MTAPVRVAIVEPQALYKESLARVLRRSPDMDVRSDIRDAPVDVALVGTSVLEMQAANAVIAIRAANPQMKMCALVVPGCERSLELARSMCPEGLASTNATPLEVIGVVRAVARGERVIGAGLARASSGRRRARDRGVVTDLSQRETEVIRLIVGGLSNKEISTALVLSEKTVKNHVSRIFSKLQVTARTQAAVHALRHGMAD